MPDRDDVREALDALDLWFSTLITTPAKAAKYAAYLATVRSHVELREGCGVDEWSAFCKAPERLRDARAGNDVREALERMPAVEYEVRYDAFVREQTQACPERLMMHFIAERTALTQQQATIARLEEALRFAKCHMTMTDDAECLRATDDDDGPGCDACRTQVLAAVTSTTEETPDAATGARGRCPKLDSCGAAAGLSYPDCLHWRDGACSRRPATPTEPTTTKPDLAETPAQEETP